MRTSPIYIEVDQFLIERLGPPNRSRRLSDLVQVAELNRRLDWIEFKPLAGEPRFGKVIYSVNRLGELKFVSSNFDTSD